MAAPAPPEVVDAALLAVADGATHAAAAQIVGVTQPTVSKWVARLQERLERLTLRLRARATRNVLAGIDGMTAARIRDASNEESRTGAQSYDALMRHSLPKGPESLTVYGGVDLSQTLVNADVRAIVLDPAKRDALLAEAYEKLGIGRKRS